MSERRDISDEAVQDATGNSWREWFDTLDELGAGDMTHKEIASTLQDRELVESGWWAQSITVAYEKENGTRVKGQTKDAGFQVGTQKTLPLTAAEAWDLVTSLDGRRIWIGDDAPGLEFEPGNSVETGNGYRIEIRTIAEGERIRLRWTPSSRSEPTTLQLYLRDKGEKTAIQFHHEKLADADEREEMKQHWKDVLGRLKELYEQR